MAVNYAQAPKPTSNPVRLTFPHPIGNGNVVSGPAANSGSIPTFTVQAYDDEGPSASQLYVLTYNPVDVNNSGKLTLTGAVAGLVYTFNKADQVALNLMPDVYTWALTGGSGAASISAIRPNMMR